MYRLVLGLLACFSLYAQTSALQGVVTDPQGAAIPTAVVSLTNEDTAATRKTLTQQNGAYSFAQLPPGAYKLEVQSPGFRPQIVPIRLQVNTPATLDIKLDVGQVASTVEVMSEAISVNTQNATMGNPFNETQIRQLPIQTRNVVDLLSLQPGVTPTGEVAGAKRDQNNVVLDGVDVNDPQPNGTNANFTGFRSALPVPLDSVQEFRTTIAGQGADQGRSSGGQVSLVTKSGSNQLHGSLYEFHRNKVTAANNWFSNRAGIPRENLVRNQYGASVGGKIIRNRAFYFLNWEDRKDRTASAVTRTVPTESFKQGILKMRLSNGTIAELTPADVRSADPLKLGANQTQLDMLKRYPVGNDPASSADGGLNFSILRFNAPKTLNYRTYVAKTDFNLDAAGKHTLMFRGTLADNSEDDTLAQFPGEPAQARLVDASKGMAARYTTVLSNSVVNVFNYGYTRLKSQTTGSESYAPTFVVSNLAGSFPRGQLRITPTHNFVDDLTWNKGKHTIQTGINFRIISNDRTNFNNFPSYSFSRNTLAGLGADINDSALAVALGKYGLSGARIADGTQVTNAFGALLGVINQYSYTYNFGVDGTAIPMGTPFNRSFGTSEYEFYVQDAWRVRRDLTVTYGLRYGLYAVPSEKNGVQVNTTVPLEQYFAERVYGSAAGIPSHALPSAQLTYDLAGPTYGKPGWYGSDKNNWAPRLAVAWAPEDNSLGAKLFGKSSVLRASGGIVYDRYGSTMVTSFASTGSPGLASQVSQPVNTDFSTSVRYNGSNLPSLPIPPVGNGMPFTPPTLQGGFTSFSGVASNLVAPYSILLNASYARPIGKGLTVEAGYVGRLSRKGLVRQDFSQPMTNYRDPKSGMTWAQASGMLRNIYESGITPAQVRSNPSFVAPMEFFENLFAKSATIRSPQVPGGNATANYFYTVYGKYAGSDLDALHDMDRVRQADGTCISAPGCNTFFALQSAGLQSYVNANNSSYHSGQIVLRRPVQSGWGFDFNYTLSHAIDIASSSEATGGTLLQDAYNPAASRASADFDIRHNITTNGVFDLPFGRRGKFLSNAPGWLNLAIGGWQVSGLFRYTSGLPTSISTGGVYPTNYLSGSIAILKPGEQMPESRVQYNQQGQPSIFPNTAVSTRFYGQFPGTVGARNAVRMAPVKNVDMSLAKFFPTPWEGHRVQLRAEAFNAFNNVNFNDLQLTLNNPGTFGRFNGARDARVMQFALRYEF